MQHRRFAPARPWKRRNCPCSSVASLLTSSLTPLTAALARLDLPMPPSPVTTRALGRHDLKHPSTASAILSLSLFLPTKTAVGLPPQNPMELWLDILLPFPPPPAPPSTSTHLQTSTCDVRESGRGGC